MGPVWPSRRSPPQIEGYGMTSPHLVRIILACDGCGHQFKKYLSVVAGLNSIRCPECDKFLTLEEGPNAAIISRAKERCLRSNRARMR
jgi:hypothetical protein